MAFFYSGIEGLPVLCHRNANNQVTRFNQPSSHARDRNLKHVSMNNVSFAVRLILVLVLPASGVIACVLLNASAQPYSSSHVIEKVDWYPDTYFSAAHGSDLFPTAWGVDGKIYTAWGDGGGVGQGRKKSYGVSTIEGTPPRLTFRDIYWGPDGEGKGKIIDLISINGVLYATFNAQENKWPDVTYCILKSHDRGKSWMEFPWKWPGGKGTFEPRRFLHKGRDFKSDLYQYLYIYGRKVYEPEDFYLARVPVKEIENEHAYRFLSGFRNAHEPVWSSSQDRMIPIFTDPNTSEFVLNSFCVQYLANIERYIAVTSHGGGGQIGIFDASAPWGPWTTVAYYDDWFGMSGGIFLSMSFPEKWIDKKDLSFWAVFSVHGSPTPDTYHDKLNLVKGRFKLK